jgi:hypothetical protein
MTKPYQILKIKEYPDGKGVSCSFTKSYLQDGEFRFDETRFYVFVNKFEAADVAILSYMKANGWI